MIISVFFVLTGIIGGALLAVAVMEGWLQDWIYLIRCRLTPNDK